MADIKSQAVKLMAEEIIRAINKITDDNNRGYVNNQITNHGGSGGGSGGGGSYPGTIPASQVSGLTTAIANYIYNAPAQAEQGDPDAGRVITTLNGLSALVVQSATIDTAQIENLYGSYGEFINLVAEKAHLEEVDTEELYAQFAEMGLSNIGTANIGFGQIKDLVSDTAIIREGVGGRLFIDRLSVSDANMLSLTTGELMLKNTAGQFVRIVVDSETGDIGSEVVTFDGDDVFNNGSLSGTKIIENSITARELNVSSIFADTALINAIKAANIDVNDLFANTTFTNKITSPAVGSNIDISSNASILLTQGRIDLLIDGTSSTTQLVITDGLIRAIGNKFSVIANTIDLSANTSISAKIRNQVSRGDTPPSTPEPNGIWIDTSGDEPIWKKYSNGNWVEIEDVSDLPSGYNELATTVLDVELRLKDSINASVSRIETLEEDTGDIEQRLSDAEVAITPETITATVLSQTKIDGYNKTEFETQISGIAVTPESFNTVVGEELKDGTSNISQINQTASKINLVVTNGSSQGSLTLTEDMLSAIASKVDLMATDPDSSLTAQFELTPSKLETVIQDSGASTTIKQTIGKISATVSSVDGQGNVTLTDKALDAIANEINLTTSNLSIVVGSLAQSKVDDLKVSGRNFVLNSKSLRSAIMVNAKGVYRIGNKLYIYSGVNVERDGNSIKIT